MPLIAAYDSSDAYWTEEEVEKMKKEDPKGNEYLEPGYQDNVDQIYWDDFEYETKIAFSKRKFPLVLVARSSNWRGQDGYAKCDNVEEVISKVTSFDGSYINLYRGRGGSLWFTTATHDVPTGFTIEVKPYNRAYWE